MSYEFNDMLVGKEEKNKEEKKKEKNSTVILPLDGLRSGVYMRQEKH
jgi:hypothetical protein